MSSVEGGGSGSECQAGVCSGSGRERKCLTFDESQAVCHAGSISRLALFIHRWS